MQNKKFDYSYTAPTDTERREIESIRRQYAEKSGEEATLERLKGLHSFVTGSAKALGISLGVVGTLIFGLGLTSILEWSALAVGITISTVGAAVTALAYPAYKLLLTRNKRKYSAEILRLSDELIGESEEK